MLRKMSLVVIPVLVLMLTWLAPGSVRAAKVSNSEFKIIHSPLKTMETAAEKGEPSAQTRLGMVKLYGFGVAPNFLAARQWFEKAAAQNYPEALVQLGIIYGNGMGVKADLEKAREYFEKAAAQKYPHAQYRLAFWYLMSDNKQKDPAKARQLLDKSCKGGFETACAVTMLQDHKRQEAIKILEPQCRTGEQEACSLLALLNRKKNMQKGTPVANK